MSSFIKLHDVKSMTGLSRSSIYKFITEGKFPTQVKLSDRAVAWVLSDVQKWMEDRIAASRSSNLSTT